MSPDPINALGQPDMPTAFALLASVRRRLLTLAGLQAASAGLALVAALVVTTSVWRTSVATGWALAAAGGVVLAVAAFVRATRSLNNVDVGLDIEQRAPQFDNLLVTALQLTESGQAVHPLVQRELARQVEERVQSVDATTMIPLRRAALVAGVVLIGTVLVSWGALRARAQVSETGGAVAAGEAATASSASTMRVTVTPPDYASRPATTVQDVAQVDVLEGSRVRVDIAPAGGPVQLIEAGQPPVALDGSDDRRTVEIVAERSRFLLLRSAGGAAAPDRLLAVLVTPDAAPVVRIRQPARDLLFPEPVGTVPVEIEASDDIGLASVTLHYTRASGSGENLTFEEGELPVAVQRLDGRRWEARTALSLAALKLADGDTLVYRAMVRDHRPGRDPSASEAFLLEVGKAAQASSAGFALPDDKDRQALSQQMLIVKTERLHAERARLPTEEFENRSRMLAVEQRMVRAEFVFMTGGEVEDEVAEAEHAHDLVEGRFENEGQVELLTAIREMSRAEARLNDAETGPALAFERSALKALQRAFDRRRYLLRTLSERARIDQTRRLTGELKEARSWRRPPITVADAEQLVPLEALARDLAAARNGDSANLAALAARLGAMAANAPDVQKAALALSASTGASAAERAQAVDEALRLVAAQARRALAPAREWVPHDPAAGRFADAWAREGGKQ